MPTQVSISWRASFSLSLLLSIANTVAVAQAPTGTYTEVVAQVVFSDEQDSDHPLSVTDLGNAASEIDQYFSKLSYGKLNFHVSFVRVHLGGTWSSYNAPCSNNCPNLAGDAANAVLAGNPNALNGVSGFSFLVLDRYAGDVTGFGLTNLSGVSQQVVASRLAEHPKNTVNPPGPSQVTWGGWAHEFGHQLEVFGGTSTSGPWVGHPSGYSSGYDEMDSCYPCDESAYGFLGAPFIGDPRTVFPGWLDASHVATVPVPTNGPVGQTFVLSPLSENISNPVTQAVFIPIDGQRTYVVNARKRVNDDALQDNTPQGIFSEGVQIQYADQNGTGLDGDSLNQNFAVKNCVQDPSPGCHDPRNPDNTRPIIAGVGWPYLLWQPGNTFTDPAQNITISVVSAVTDGYEVNIGRDVPPNHPDLFITPWLTPPMDTYETVDIWVDSSCNGYEDATHPLKYGRRQDGTVIGSGDDPCVNHENRVYAIVHNIGDAAAPATTATFQVSDPLGVGVSGNWKNLGVANLPVIASGGSATVFVTWTPVVNVPPQEHFKFHTCIQVLVSPAAGEVVTSNNNAQENIDYFEAVAQGTPVNEKFQFLPVSRTFELTNNIPGSTIAPEQRSFTLRTVSHLPVGWTYSVNNGQDTTALFQGQTVSIPVQVNPAPSPVGQIYDLKVDALTVRTLENLGNARSTTHLSWYAAGGINLSAHTVLPSQLSVSAATTAAALPLPVVVKGRLTPARPNASVMVDLTDANAKMVSQLVTVQPDGSFLLSVPNINAVSVVAIWQGDMLYSSAVANGSVLISTDTDHDGIPDAIDNCPYAFNPDQKDTGGIGFGSPPDGIGDACQCGDVNNDGIVNNTDATLIRRSFLGLPPYPGGVATLPGYNKCQVVNGAPGLTCNNTQASLIQRAVVGLAPGIKQGCHAATIFP